MGIAAPAVKVKVSVLENNTLLVLLTALVVDRVKARLETIGTMDDEDEDVSMLDDWGGKDDGLRGGEPSELASARLLETSALLDEDKISTLLERSAWLLDTKTALDDADGDVIVDTGNWLLGTILRDRIGEGVLLKLGGGGGGGGSGEVGRAVLDAGSTAEIASAEVDSRIVCGTLLVKVPNVGTLSRISVLPRVSVAVLIVASAFGSHAPGPIVLPSCSVTVESLFRYATTVG